MNLISRSLFACLVAGAVALPAAARAEVACDGKDEKAAEKDSNKKKNPAATRLCDGDKAAEKDKDIKKKNPAATRLCDGDKAAAEKDKDAKKKNPALI